MQKTDIEQKIIIALTENEELYDLNRFLICAAAGTLLTGITEKPHIIRCIAYEYSDALADPRDGEWETELGRLTLAGDIEKLRELAQETFRKNPQCPNCFWSSRIRLRGDGSYVCDKCKHSWRL